MANVIGLPSFDWAFASPCLPGRRSGSRMNPSPTRIKSPSAPERIIVCNGA
jgi:hypothetical protein